jgi:hypothetical protein
MECEEHLRLLYKHVQRHFDAPISIRGISIRGICANITCLLTCVLPQLYLFGVPDTPEMAGPARS